ncbi:sigma-70 family RNA polymerase sigma factor [Candidatus Uhrbacteria bacterium]|nr:sigma-70 family RNA polymerase sigma factor [Candidatus Uhrbacteria bacterium]
MTREERGVLLVTDAAGRIAYVSRSVENWSGFSVAESVGAKPGDLWGGNMDKSFYQSMWKSIAIDKKSFSSRLANRSKAGRTLPSLLTVLPVMQNGAPKYFFAMQPDPAAWNTFDMEFSTQWQRLARDPVALSLWIERWIGTKIDVLPDESVVSCVERALIDPMSERFAGRDLDHRSVLLAQQDMHQYASLFERYYGTIVGYLRRRLADAAEAEDLAQDVFIKAMNGLSRYQVRNASYKTYLLRIAHNELLNRYRRITSEMKNAERMDIPPAGSMIESMENRDALERAMDILTESDRQILKAFYTEGCSVSEIAIRTGKSENAVKLVLSRSRKRLRGEL